MLGIMENPANIERVRFRTDEEAEFLGHLGEQASSVLGYGKLLKAAGGSLRAILCELDIHPLVTSKVEAYKRSKERTGIWSGHKWALFHFAVCFVFAAILGWSVSASHNLPDFTFWCVVGYVVNVLAVIGIICFQIAGWIYTFDHNLSGWRDLRRWSKYSMQNYPGAIPDFVLSKALQIRKVMPTAEFYIDQLETKREQTVVYRDPDPFLIVTTRNGGESYYIEVWDEKEYELTM